MFRGEVIQSLALYQTYPFTPGDAPAGSNRLRPPVEVLPHRARLVSRGHLGIRPVVRELVGHLAERVGGHAALLDAVLAERVEEEHLRLEGGRKGNRKESGRGGDVYRGAERCE